MSSGRCRLIHVGLLEWFLPFVLAPPAAARLSSRSSRCLSLLACPPPLTRVGERGAWTPGFIASRGLSRAGGLASWVMGNECVDFVDVLPIG